MSLNELFTKNNENTTNNHLLNGTAELTRVSTEIAHRMVKHMDEHSDEFVDKLKESAHDSKAMDDLITELKDTTDTCIISKDDTETLESFDEASVDGMLKSQQSKRSRCKGKAMTLDNYISMLTAALAENILREIYNRPKSASFGSHRGGSVEYTSERLQQLSDDQEALRREIRNIQSKKSIMKSKANFDDESEQWLALLKAEETLKSLRIPTSGRSVVRVDETKDKLSEMLDGIDLEHLKAADSKELLSSIAGMIKAGEN